eukprot:gene28992-34994_t
MSASIVLALGICFLILFVAQSQKTDNIDGTYAVKKNHHYSNKTSVTWGQNGLPDFQVMISLAPAAATYDCQNTSTYSCEDSSYMYDWNKLWGKARCGYTHDHHEDSDRFVFRKCSDSSCAAYTGTAAIQLAAYSYDNGVPPYTGENPGLLKEFHTLIFPDTQYILQLIMDSTGLSTFNLRDKYGSLLESQYVQHSQLCEDNFYEGTVQGLYFGGTCAAPEEIVCTYWS